MVLNFFSKDLSIDLGTANTLVVLKDQGVLIWDDNATREFLDSRNLKHYR